MSKFSLMSLLRSDSLQGQKDLFYNNVIGFRDVVDGAGASTIIRSVAEMLAARKLRVGIIDLHITKHPLSALCGCDNSESKKKSILQYKKGLPLSDFIQPTHISKNIFVMEPVDSTLDTLLSDQDNADTVLSFIEELKMQRAFSFILINIGNEPSQISEELLGHCNIIFPVLTPALTCTSHLQMFLAENYAMCINTKNTRSVIINKVLPSQSEAMHQIFSKDADSEGLRILVELPFSAELYQATCAGQSLVRNDMVTELTQHSSIVAFSQGIDRICAYLYELNSKNY